MTGDQHQGPHAPDDPARYWRDRELRRLHDHPTMPTGEKAAKISALLGSSFGRESWRELKKRLQQTS